MAIRLAPLQIYQQNVQGGLSTHRRSGRYSGSYDLELDLDLGKLGLLPNGQIYMLTEGTWSDGIDPSSVGSLFNVNGDAMGNEAAAIIQLYYEQSFFEDRLITRIGKLDLTGAFQCRGCPVSFDGNSYANDENTQFLNGSLINNPTIPFPQEGLGAVVHANPVEWWYMSAGVADANANRYETGFNTAFHGPDDFFSIYETGVLPQVSSANGPMQGAYRVGFWYDPLSKEYLDGSGRTKRDNLGLYASADQLVFKENKDEKDTQGLGLFGRYGLANKNVSEIAQFWSAGCQYEGLIPSRDQDVLGFGVGQGIISDEAGLPASNETALESYYNISITKYLRVSPDLQYIFNPDGAADSNHAFVIGLRVQVIF